jgi:hypothetical protein
LLQREVRQRLRACSARLAATAHRDRDSDSDGDSDGAADRGHNGRTGETALDRFTEPQMERPLVPSYSGAGEGRLPIHSSAKSSRPGPLIHPLTVRDWLRVVACTIECSAVITAYTCPPPSLCSLAWSPPCRTQHGHPNTAAGCGAPENVPLQEREACTGATAPLAPDALAACSAEPAAHACRR